jgi:ech hydrogenase subunit A
LEFSIAIFLIFFPFVAALVLYLLGNGERVYKARKVIVKGSALLIMAAAILMAVLILGRGTPYPFAEHTKAVDVLMACGEAFLMILVFYYSIRYKKIYTAVLSACGTLPILWLTFSGAEESTAPHMQIDNLTVLMILVVGIVGGLIAVYAVGYIKDYHNHHKNYKDRSNWFLAMLFVFLGAMFGLLLSDCMDWMYFFWEITSVCSFLLIGYNYEKESIKNSFTALWMNLLGGVGFAAAILYSELSLHVFTLSELLQVDRTVAPGVMIVVSLLAFAAMTKSAQMPFNLWLLGAMVAPTPTSALLHSATMVKAGVYLLIRIAPLLSRTTAGVMVTLIGGFTFFAASLMAIATSDGKRVLAHSTVSNLGLIVACAGVGMPESVWAGTMLILFHAVSKSLMFLCVGAVENVTGSRNIEDMHGLVVKLPRLAMVMIIGICGHVPGTLWHAGRQVGGPALLYRLRLGLAGAVPGLRRRQHDLLLGKVAGQAPGRDPRLPGDEGHDPHGRVGVHLPAGGPCGGDVLPVPADLQRPHPAGVKPALP